MKNFLHLFVGFLSLSASAVANCVGVTKYEELRQAIANSTSSSNSPRQIAICADEISVTSAISLNNKAFNLYCNLGPNYCKLNAKGNNRLFTGAPVLATFTKIDFVNANARSSEKGGALFLAGEGKLNFIETRFINNYAMRGGAMYVDSANVSVTIQKSLFQKNQATVQAGAIYLNNGTLTMIDSKFKENQAFSNGGVLYMNDGRLTVEKSLYEDNTALKSGGALFFDSVQNVKISDSKFIDNNSNQVGLLTGGGGAISSFLGKISLKNIVFQNNSGANGFDIWVEDDTNPGGPRGGGSFISCETNVTFCNTTKGYKEFGDPLH